MALIEFAMILPFLVLLFMGSYVLTDNVSRNRKVTIATRALVDMVSQSATGTTTRNELDNELAAATQVMTPFAPNASALRVSQVYTDNNLNTTVQWSRALRTTAYAANTAFTIPATLKFAGSYLLVGEVSYSYKPPVTFGIVRPRNLTDQIIMLPRNTSSISCADC